MANQHEKRRSMVNDDFSTQAQGVFSSKRSSVAGSDENGSVQIPIVSNLVKIFSEATAPKPVQTQKPRSSSVVSATSKNDELVRIMEEAAGRSQRPSTSSAVRAPLIQHYDPAYEQIAWDTITDG